MFCVACMIFAHGVVVNVATALLLMSRKKKLGKMKDTCVCNDVCFARRRRRIIHVVCFKSKNMEVNVGMFVFSQSVTCS